MPGRAARLARLPPDWGRHAFAGLVAPRTAPDPLRVVQAVVLDGPRVLLATRRDLLGWELPGGNPRAGEGDEVALRREVREETGLEVEIESHVGDYHRTGFLPHRARVFRCRPVGGSPRPSLETPRVAWWRASEPPASLFPWYRGPLADALAGGDPVTRHERQGLAAIWAGIRTDLTSRWHGIEDAPPATADEALG